MSNLIPKLSPTTGAPTARYGALQPHLLEHLCRLVAGRDEATRSAVLAYIEAFGPKDAIEELSVAQMVATSQAAMVCFQRAATEVDKLGLRDIELRHGEKLLNLYSRLFEAFEKRRNRLQIEHILPGLPGLTQVPRR